MLSQDLRFLTIWFDRFVDGELEMSATCMRAFAAELRKVGEQASELEATVVPATARTPAPPPAWTANLSSATRGLVAVASALPGTNVVLFPVVPRPRPPAYPNGAA